ncbi:MAG TPA: hypothetical protein PK936_01215 [Smithellaceae bacterium]|nr:hypothetical protein [Smithellaceae bacterium]
MYNLGFDALATIAPGPPLTQDVPAVGRLDGKKFFLDVLELGRDKKQRKPIGEDDVQYRRIFGKNAASLRPAAGHHTVVAWFRIGPEKKTLMIVGMMEVHIYHILHKMKAIPQVDEFALPDGLFRIRVPDQIFMMETQWNRSQDMLGGVLALHDCFLTVLVHSATPPL